MQIKQNPGRIGDPEIGLLSIYESAIYFGIRFKKERAAFITL
jgi:hypothetical protein